MPMKRVDFYQSTWHNIPEDSHLEDRKIVKHLQRHTEVKREEPLSGDGPRFEPCTNPKLYRYSNLSVFAHDLVTLPRPLSYIFLQSLAQFPTSSTGNKSVISTEPLQSQWSSKKHFAHKDVLLRSPTSPPLPLRQALVFRYCRKVANILPATGLGQVSRGFAKLTPPSRQTDRQTIVRSVFT